MDGDFQARDFRAFHQNFSFIVTLTDSSFSFYWHANSTSKGRVRRVAGSLSIWAAPGLLSPNPAATHPEVPESNFDEAPRPALQPQS